MLQFVFWFDFCDCIKCFDFFLKQFFNATKNPGKWILLKTNCKSDSNLRGQVVKLMINNSQYLSKLYCIKANKIIGWI